ncbi:hypothetical protein EWS92_23355 [Vibrio vulnificus]|uniref:hypothetical protein n=1 Tax=Vibrio vulnificus TaxID=672 RepID=UPI000BA092B2|nr:hypothetical protein [Vibrio vulnificus]EGR0791361.1 hypothetical protein [Vibrio vulnificus]EGR0799901.1 hypothetical protein [Vibrio vulnificus]EGR0817026.1 hypothetical protein [Vibrio vulnificus]EGR0879917.1 hypothetical protein [Vibrio vulnificus]EGR5273854.1 hypothetical protein [Vibrio vulnificus]
MKKVKLGFYAVKFGSVALCHGASLVVTHDKSTLRELAPVNKGHLANGQEVVANDWQKAVVTIEQFTGLES